MFFRFLASCFLCSLAIADAQEIYPLTKLLIADSEEKVAALPADAGGNGPVFVQDVPLFENFGFRVIVTKYLGKPIGNEVLNDLANAIAQYARDHDHLVAKVLIPNQNVSNGVLRFAVVLGRYKHLSFQGNRWFSSKVLEERLGIRPGDEVRLSTLEEAVNWINTNPFRSAKVLVNELPNEPGKVDLIVGIHERRPYRAAFSIDDTGNTVIGRRRLAGSLQFGNLWARDHQGSYQYLTTDEPDVYRGHAFDYRVPLNWRHFIQVSGTYVSLEPTFGGGDFTHKGRNILADAKYTIPFQIGNEPRDLSFGLSFKQSNNNLEFGGTQVRSTKTNTFQAYVSWSMLERDSRGAWMFAATVNASPGKVNSRNTGAAYQEARFGASPTYIYGSIAAQRLLNLGKGWDLFTRAALQRSSTNLLPNEQMVIGGAGTARGYDDNIFAGDNGFVFATDLMSPAWRTPLPFASKQAFLLETRAVGFLDIAKVEYRERAASDIKFSPLASIGIGLRSNLGTIFSFSFDYGWQLVHLPQQVGQPRRLPLTSRGHVKAVLAF